MKHRKYALKRPKAKSQTAKTAESRRAKQRLGGESPSLGNRQPKRKK